jgi:chromosome segregation ATPase
MAEKKGVGHAYNVDFLNVVFAASSLFLFLSVVWMVWDDYDRDWKNTQRRFDQLRCRSPRLSSNRLAARSIAPSCSRFEAQLRTAQKNVSANQQKVDELQAKAADVDNRLYRATQDYQAAKANYDQDRYDFEASRVAGSSSAEKKAPVVEEELRRLTELNLAREKAEADKADIQKQLGQYTGQVATITKQIDDMTTEQTRLKKQLDVIAPSAVKDYFRNAPLLDFMAPTIKIQQLILPNIVDDVNFIRVPKIDRCQTCHLGIDKKG